MPKERRTIPGEVHKEYWKRTVKEAFKNDPLRIIIELIKNAADSYTRLEKKEKGNPPFEIFVRILCRRGSPPSIEVKDHAEGMDSKKLEESLKYGTPTSMGEDIDAVTSAEKGIGLKDAMMALKDNWLITIKDNLINERNKHPNFYTGIGKEDERVTEKERKKLGIPHDGTIVKGELPEYFHDRKFSTICEHLKKHFLIRKLLQNPKYKIYVIDGGGRKTLLEWKPPEVEKQILKETFKINYNGRDYPIDLLINKSKKELSPGKPFGESGLLFFYGKYSVVDFTFCRFDREISFSKFFGEVKMVIEEIIRDPDESPLVDEKRRGLDPQHPFNEKLFVEINKRLMEIQEEEETSKYSLDAKTKKEILKEINKLYKEIKGKGLPPEPPIKPETFTFYPPHVSLIEYEPKAVFLIINSSIVSDKLEISLQSTNQDIVIKKSNIKIEKEKIKEEFIIRKIELYSEKKGIRGEIIATSKQSGQFEKMGVEVLENPIFSPENGFAFVPSKTTIVDGGEKNVDLCIDKSILKESREITFSSSDPINCLGKWLLPNKENLEKCDYSIKNILKIEIPIKVRGTGYIGKKAIIAASYGDRTSNLNVTVVPEPAIGGLLRDIRPSAKSTKKISTFIKEKGVIEIYYKHPLIKKYMKGKDFRKKLDFLTFIADIITREAIRAMVLSGIEENLSKFHIFDMDHPEPEIEDHIICEYYEQGIKMHELFKKLAKTFKMGE